MRQSALSRQAAIRAGIPLALTAACICLGCARPSVHIDPEDIRVISLAPSITEMVCAIGGSDLLVGRTTACDYPPDIVSKIPVIGGFGVPSIELLLTARPTVILEVDLEDEALAARIADMGMHRERVKCRSIDDIPDAMMTIGAAIGKVEQARVLAESLRKGVAALRVSAQSVTNRPTVYVEIWNDPMMTSGRGTFLSELVYLAGGRNLGDTVEKEYFQVSPEWVVSMNPDIILCLYMSTDSSIRQLVLHRAGWQHVKAVKSGAVYDQLDNNTILRPGPRVLEGIAAVSACISGNGGNNAR